MTQPARQPRTLTSADAPMASYPWTPWPRVQNYVNSLWDPEQIPHHSIVAQTRGGKTFLATEGILKPMCKYDRVLIVDTKGDDPSLQVGQPVKRIPKNTWYTGMGRRRDKPYEKWYRVIAPKNRQSAHDMIGEVLDNCYDEGEWVIYIDELWEVTGKFHEDGLDLGGIMSRLWRKGGYRHVSVVSGTQTPVAVPRLFYDQAGFAWIGAIRDEDRQKRLLEIGGISKKDLPVLSTLKRRQWLLCADGGEYFARTIVTKGG